MNNKHTVFNIGLTFAGTAAVTTLVLWLFQDSAENHEHMRGEYLRGEQTDVALETSQPTKTPKKQEKIPSKVTTLPPIIGEGTSLFPDYIAGLLSICAKAEATTPHAVGTIDNFGEKIVLVTKPEHVKKILDTQTAHALGGLKPASEAFFGKQVLFVLEGKEWRDLRNLMRHSFVPTKLPMMALDVTDAAYELSNYVGRHRGSDDSIDMNLAFGMYHLSAIGKAAFNYDLECFTSDNTHNQIHDAFEYMLQQLPIRAFSQDPSVVNDFETDNEANRTWNKHANAVRNVITRVVEARLEEHKAQQAPRHDLLDNMILGYEKEYGGTMSAIQLVDALGDNLVELLFAGYNTSVVTMCVALYYISSNPEWKIRVQEEVDQVLSNHSSGKPIQTSKLKVCRAVVDECLRLVPPAPLVARMTTSSLELEEGIELSEQTNVWLPVIHLHKDQHSWGSDSATFNPGRWLGQDAPCPPGAFTPFSGGPRGCIGSHFAYLETITSLAVLWKDFEFYTAPGFDFAPCFTGFGLRPFDKVTQKVCMNLRVENRVTEEILYDWSPSPLEKEVLPVVDTSRTEKSRAFETSSPQSTGSGEELLSEHGNETRGRGPINDVNPAVAS
mmetsp:Transcript_19985/g.32960  ORF Transcript_19985/g.32960 Transcript_19985/m.32960 type:complete len:612 (+) Transcript_19985:158-1993(+)|eukprot:CAMPEP_0203749468 /NCGR_PEP_ID=MMETSP0098-20131031/4028_1 /ASSEMBLY_ACC=CAM_ASM_000208 /TAXON_ID=96639 /ORGANISM=" , Strain NY0313808BC1" /LENGTH=611 /DNA_ID=CAMNT_0050638539 /DNA_START=145 /DNA_END=1980 /DNA_ORIENTATION=+